MATFQRPPTEALICSLVPAHELADVGVPTKCAFATQTPGDLPVAQRMRAVWRAVMEATDAEGRRRAEIFERLPSPDELPVFENASFSEQFLHYKRSVYQCRLGTKIGNAERKDTLRFLQVYYEVVAEPMDLDRIDKNLALGESRSGTGISLESRSGGGASRSDAFWCCVCRGGAKRLRRPG